MLGQFILRRLIVTVPLLLGVTLVTFMVSHVIPADPLMAILPERAANDPEIVRMYRERWGLDRSLPEQYLFYLRNLLRGDLGESYTSRRPVAQDLRERFPATVELALAAMLYAVAVGVTLGIVSAVWYERWIDHLARVIALVGVSLPVFWLGLLALQLFYANLRLLPGPGRIDPRLTAPPFRTGFYTIDSLLAGDLALFVNVISHLILPGMVLGSYAMGIIARMTRSALLDVLQADYIRTARAKGLAERRVVLGHALRNALIPTVTVIGLTFGSLLAGAVLTETIFAWPGIGRYAVDAAMKLDLPAVLGVTLLIAVVYVTINFVTDILYGVLDPRIRAQ
ncbi:ABC transporter permease [Thermomicrobium sp. 4228-Ro]|uniref:ABC transporter permease n=1 Tax=Thermomicrobium sp. 4228-Ro TaxID=2993937 RepID=UPI00224924C8|nr:ABC transporter permease [Thermomicrobium sp. 4228-Ro]MCX2726863.1 ABC transporter permease [Thermomicrobium sp. 4228-Ro]